MSTNGHSNQPLAMPELKSYKLKVSAASSSTQMTTQFKDVIAVTCSSQSKMITITLASSRHVLMIPLL